MIAVPTTVLMRTLAAAMLLSAVAMEGATMPSMAQEGSRSRPMELAILTGQVDAVRKLVEAGANVDERMFRDETPALMAASTGAWDIVLYLLKNGADPAAENLSGTTLTRYALDSLVALDTPEGAAREEVKTILARRGLL